MGYDEEYEGLLSKAKSTPESADFQQLRFAYARSSQYNPYGASTADLWGPGRGDRPRGWRDGDGGHR